MKMFALLLLAFALTGCASLTRSTWQGMTVTAENAKSDTVCDASNDRGEYPLVAGTQGKVKRSGTKLHISCYNATQAGQIDVTPAKSMGTRFANFIMFDFCTISCMIDRKTGKVYGYLPRQTVYMVDRR